MEQAAVLRPSQRQPAHKNALAGALQPGPWVSLLLASINAQGGLFFPTQLGSQHPIYLQHYDDDYRNDCSNAHANRKISYYFPIEAILPHIL
jgi:hypothetical protein